MAFISGSEGWPFLLGVEVGPSGWDWPLGSGLALPSWAWGWPALCGCNYNYYCNHVMLIISEGGGKEDRGWPFGLGSALGIGVGPSFFGLVGPSHSWVGVDPSRGGSWPFLFGFGVGPSRF